MLIKPNFDRILAKKIVENNKSFSGIEFKEEIEIEKAIVLDVSNNLKNISNIKVGDFIYFEPFSAISLPKENLILIKEIDVLGYEKKGVN